MWCLYYAQHLKNKLGTRQLPTAEMLLDGTEAYMVITSGRQDADIESRAVKTARVYPSACITKWTWDRHKIVMGWILPITRNMSSVAIHWQRFFWQWEDHFHILCGHGCAYWKQPPHTPYYQYTLQNHNSWIQQTIPTPPWSSPLFPPPPLPLPPSYTPPRSSPSYTPTTPHSVSKSGEPLSQGTTPHSVSKELLPIQ